MEAAKQQQLWWAALKLPMYSVAVMPILLGSSLALLQQGALHWDRLGCFLGAAILILAWENLSNDVFDAETGIDRHKSHSVVQLLGNRSGVLIMANGCLLGGVALVLTIVWQQQDPTVLLLVLACCALGYCYQGPPFRLGYQGLGEVLCFLAFGPLAVGAAYYSQSQGWHGSILFPSLINGLSTSLILFCSHFHQLEDDRAAGKFSPIVRLGTARAAQLIPWSCGSLYALTAGGVMCQSLPAECLALFLSLPLAWQLVRQTQQFHDQPLAMRNCKFIAVALHFWSNVGLISGLVLNYAL